MYRMIRNYQLTSLFKWVANVYLIENSGIGTGGRGWGVVAPPLYHSC